MRPRLLVAALVACAALPAPVRAAAAAGDWVLVRVVAGAAGATAVDIAISGSARPVEESVVAGDIAGYSSHSVATVLPYAGPVVVEASTPAGHHRVTLAGGGREAIEFSSRSTLDLEPSESHALLVFVTGSIFDRLSVAAIAGSGSIAVTQTRGSGATATTIVGEPGVAAGAGPAAAGAIERTSHAESGVVGGFADRCERCEGTWRAPDGRSGTWTGTGVNAVAAGAWIASGHVAFAGGAGSWSLGWRGATTGSGTTSPAHGPAPLVAYAPVGEHWTAFPTGRR